MASSLLSSFEFFDGGFVSRLVFFIVIARFLYCGFSFVAAGMVTMDAKLATLLVAAWTLCSWDFARKTPFARFWFHMLFNLDDIVIVVHMGPLSSAAS
jgi:hypothetical protein